MNLEQDYLSKLPVPGKDGITVVPIGGLGRIGMNWTLYGFNERWVLVDAGVGFPDEELSDIDAFIPDPSFIQSILDKLDGLVITHAHEDHIGSIDRLWPHIINCPIYASPFCSEILMRRFIDRGVENDVTINPFQVGGKFKVGNLTFDSVELTHSVPEPVGFLISSGDIKIFHTGDWKMDEFPLIGNGVDYDKLEAFRKQKVTAMVCDSTNAHRELERTSEADVRESFVDIMEKSKGMVVIACFGTNIARAQSAIYAAGESNRKIAMGGYSLRNNYQTAVRQGMVLPNRFLLENSYQLKGLDRNEMAIICTGGQAEENAILSKMARGIDKRFPHLQAGDVVIISASKIPQRVPYIEALINDLRSQNITVYCNGDFSNGYPVHVTGHASSNEIDDMHNLIEPKFIIPVHGEDMHLSAHENIAKNNGIPSVRGEEGSILLVTPNSVTNIGKVYISIMPLYSDEFGNRMVYQNPENPIEDENKDEEYELKM